MEDGVRAKVSGMLGIRCHRENWYMLLVMDYIEGEPKSDNNENSEAVFMDVKQALLHDDVTHMTKVALRAMLDKGAILLISDLEYKETKGEDYELYI